MGYVRLAEVQATSAFPGVSHRLAVGKASGATGIQMGELVLEPGAAIPVHHHDVDDPQGGDVRGRDGKTPGWLRSGL